MKSFEFKHYFSILAYVVILDVRSTSDLPIELILKSFQEFLTLVNVLPGPPKISMMGVFCIADIEVKVCLGFWISIDMSIITDPNSARVLWRCS